MPKKIGIFIARMNPPHKWHIKTIKKILKENDNSLILFWSTNKKDELNPFSYEEKNTIIEKYFEDFMKNNILKISFIDDHESDEIWIKNLSEKIDNLFWKTWYKLKFYWGDLENDSAIQVIKTFEKLLPAETILYKEISRKNSFVVSRGEKYEISWTQIRLLWKDKNLKIIKKMLEKDMQKDIISLFKKYGDNWKNL